MIFIFGMLKTPPSALSLRLLWNANKYAWRSLCADVLIRRDAHQKRLPWMKVQEPGQRDTRKVVLPHFLPLRPMELGDFK